MPRRPEAGRETCWRNLCEAVAREIDAMGGGSGRLTIEVAVRDGAPKSVHVLKREAFYLLDQTQPPLTGAGPLARLQPTE